MHETKSPDYADALSKGFGVSLLVTESTGAVSPALDALLRRYSRLSRAPGTTDHTRYGVSPASPRDFYRHHLAAHSAAVGHADAVVLLKQAATLGHALTGAQRFPTTPPASDESDE